MKAIGSIGFNFGDQNKSSPTFVNSIEFSSTSQHCRFIIWNPYKIYFCGCKVEVLRILLQSTVKSPCLQMKTTSASHTHTPRHRHNAAFLLIMPLIIRTLKKCCEWKHTLKKKRKVNAEDQTIPFKSSHLFSALCLHRNTLTH